MAYLAHIRLEKDKPPVNQALHIHNRNCAQIASAANVAGLKNAAYLAGLLHDMGKYTEEFQDYLKRAASGEKVQRGSVNHTFAGVRFAFERWHTAQEPTLRNMVCEIIAVAAGAHHGLFDCIDPEGEDGLLHRLSFDDARYHEAMERFLLHCAQADELDRLFDAAEAEIASAMESIKTYVTSEGEMRFCLGLLVRMLLSAVIGGDRKDTAEVIFNTEIALQRATPERWRSLLEDMEVKLSQRFQDSEINRVRRGLSDQCCEAANRPKGIYRLSIPTGGGKTLTSLRYALATAAKQGKKRIFFVIPLLSVLEQNAAVIREYIGDNSIILEHHSNVIREQQRDDMLDENELLMETWDAPIVITTLVQLLNTLFDGKTSAIRRMHALADSVIVIDEVQSVPRKMLSLFNMAMNFLATTCNCVILLCSATQPCLEYIPHALRFQKPADLVTVKEEWKQAFSRTTLIDRRKKGGYTTEELIAFAADCMQTADSLLIVCNTKKQARAIFNAIQTTDAEVYHLSTAMCMEHRIHTLEQINFCLKHKRRVICVATQLVEAGVDFSFACVIRVSAGLDNIVQAAGRCNRSGEFGRRCPVYIVNLHQENLARLREIQQSQQAAESVMSLFTQNPQRFDQDLASDKAIEAYYRQLYINMAEHSHDFPLQHGATTIFTLLSDNRTSEHHSATPGKYVINQAFKTAGAEFTVFDNNTIDILVPYAEGEQLIDELTSSAKTDLAYRKALLDKAKRFSISLYDYEMRQLDQACGVYRLYEDDSVFVLQSGFYSEKIGFDLHGKDDCFLEV